jgi:hypothetical protein
MSTLSLPKGSSPILLFCCLFPLTPTIPAPTRPPGGGGVPVSWSDRSHNFFVSPAYAKTGGHSRKNLRAPAFPRSLPPISALGLLVFQSLAHSFIFRITLIPYPSNTFRTLSPKTRVYPPRSYQSLLQGTGPAKLRPPQKAASTNAKRANETPLPHLLPLPPQPHLLPRGHTNVTAAGGRSVLQRCFSLRGAAASIAASNGWAWSKARERRKRSARRAWAYFS